MFAGCAVAGNATVLMTALLFVATAIADDCPTPVVATRITVDGVNTMRSVQLNQDPMGGSGVLSERALNRLILANTGDIRFFVSGVGSMQSSDFLLVFEESTAGPDNSVEYRLEDSKGRRVLAPEPTKFTDDQLLGDSLNALADRIIDPARRSTRYLFILPAPDVTAITQSLGT